MTKFANQHYGLDQIVTNPSKLFSHKSYGRSYQNFDATSRSDSQHRGT